MGIVSVDLKECPHRIQSGSYYNQNPWDECKLESEPASNSYRMCKLDAGESCKVYDELCKEDKKHGNRDGRRQVHSGTEEE